MSGGASLPNNTNLVVNGTANLANGPSVSALNGTTSTAVVNLQGTSLSINNGGAYAGAISDSVGGGSVNLNGGTLTLSGTSSGFTGNVYVNNSSTLSVTGSISSANVNFNSSGVLMGTGNAGNVSFGFGNLNPGAAANTTGTLQMTSLNATGGTLQFDVGTNATDRITINGAGSISNLNGERFATARRQHLGRHLHAA